MTSPLTDEEKLSLAHEEGVSGVFFEKLDESRAVSRHTFKTYVRLNAVLMNVQYEYGCHRDELYPS